MRFIYSTAEDRLYREGWIQTERKEPDPPEPCEEIFSDQYERSADRNGARLFVFEADPKDAPAIAERLKAYANFQKAYHEQEFAKWRSGKETDNDKLRREQSED